MKKIIFVILIVLSSKIFSINVIYDKENNKNILNLDTQIMSISSNDINTFHNIKLEKAVYHDQNISVSRGPIKEIIIDGTSIKIFTYTPSKINYKDGVVSFQGFQKLDFKDINFKNIYLEDAINLFLEKTGFNWMKSEKIPEEKISLDLNEIYFENFLRIMEEVYGLHSIFYTDKNIIITKNKILFDQYLPLEFEKVVDEKNSVNEIIEKVHKKILLVESKVDIKNLESIFDVKIVNYSDTYIVEIDESKKERFLEIVQKINQKNIKNEENIAFVTNQASETINSDEIYTILKSKFDMIFLEDIYNLKYHDLGDNFYLIFSDKETILEVEKLNSLINSLETKEIDEKEEKIVLKTNLFIVNSKNIEIFGKICNEEKIYYKIIDKNENKNYVLVKASEDQINLLKKLSENEDTNYEISIKKLLTELASFENKNVIVDFEDFTVNFNNFDLVFDDIISFLTSKGIFYKKIGKNTYSFFENKKILKYKLTIIAGDNIETNSVRDLYEILNGNIAVMNNLKNSLNNTYIVTKPEIYVLEGEFGELNSVLTIPIFEEKDGKSQVVDTIESGIKLKIKGNYDRDTDIIDTQIELLLSEFSEEMQKEESGYSMNQRSLITKLKMKNGSTIKAGNMIFSKIIEKSDGLSMFKNIPVFGKLFYNEESSIRNYNIIIFLNVYTDSKAEDISL
jgi:hypothetical protein